MVDKGVQLWKEAIQNCPTFSRLHFLLAIFDSCIKWEKSAENAVSLSCFIGIKLQALTLILIVSFSRRINTLEMNRGSLCSSWFHFGMLSVSCF